MNSRYPGPTPFVTSQENVFFGRQEDADNLYNSILLNNCTILVGKSGVGKSSLLNANILPRLHQKNLSTSNFSDKRFFLIIKINVGVWIPGTIPENYISLLNKVRHQIKEQLGELSEKNFLSFLFDENITSIGFELKQYQFDYFKKNKNVVFLIIIDQVEELFTYPITEFRELLNEVNEVLSPHIPESVREYVEDIEKKNPTKITAAENEILYTPLHIKLLFSVRSDKLGLLIRFKETVPNIFSNPFELKPLSREQAFAAIKYPAEKLGDFITQPFVIVDEAIHKIVDFLYNLPKTDLENNYYDHVIDPISLQIICQHIELKIAPYDSDKLIEVHEISNIEDIFSNYYFDVLKKIECDERTLKKVRVLIEEKLIYEPDRRRRHMFLEECELDSSILFQLVQLKILREVSLGFEKSFFEVAHDWLILPILLAKRTRLAEEALQKEERVTRIIGSSFTETDVMSHEELTLNTLNADHYYDNKDYDNAIIFISRYLQSQKQKADLNEVYFSYLLKRGECYFKTKDYRNALEDLKLYTVHNEENSLVFFYIAYCYHMQNMLTTAVESYKRSLHLDPTYINAYYNLGIVYQEMEMLNESLDVFLRLTELSYNDSDAWFNAGVICNRISNYNDAIRYLQKSISLNATKIECYNEIGYAHAQLKHYHLAIDSYYSAYNLNPSNIQSLIQVKKLSQMIGDLNSNEKASLLIVGTTNNDEDAFYKLGKLEMDVNNFEAGLEYFGKAVKINHRHKEALKAIISILKILERTNELMAALNEYLKIDPYDFRMFKELGDLYFGFKNYEQAEMNYKSAYECEQANLELNEKYADTLLLLSKSFDAIPILNSCLHCAPNNIKIIEKIADTHFIVNNGYTARDYYQKFLDHPLSTTYPEDYIAKIKKRIDDLPSFEKDMKKADSIFNALQELKSKSIYQN